MDRSVDEFCRPVGHLRALQIQIQKFFFLMRTQKTHKITKLINGGSMFLSFQYNPLSAVTQSDTVMGSPGLHSTGRTAKLGSVPDRPEVSFCAEWHSIESRKKSLPTQQEGRGGRERVLAGSSPGGNLCHMKGEGVCKSPGEAMAGPETLHSMPCSLVRWWFDYRESAFLFCLLFNIFSCIECFAVSIQHMWRGFPLVRSAENFLLSLGLL